MSSLLLFFIRRRGEKWARFREEKALSMRYSKFMAFFYEGDVFFGGGAFALVDKGSGKLGWGLECS